MFWFTHDPGAEGVGVAFSDAIGPGGARLDLTGARDGRPRSVDWDLVEEALELPVVNVDQVHGTRVLAVEGRFVAAELAREPADALVTTVRGIGLSVRVADCLPVLLADPQAGVVAAAHAGRVGLADGVLVATVQAMRARGARSITAWIGPHICGSCYEVPAEMAEAVTARLPAARSVTSWGTPALDLAAGAQSQLEGLGCVVRRQDPCTRTTPSLHSYRRDGAASGRQAGIIWLASG